MNVIALRPDYETKRAATVIAHIDYARGWPGTCWSDTEEFPKPEKDSDLLHPCLSFDRDIRTIRSMQKRLINLSLVKANLTKFPELKFYIFSGKMDAIMPVEVFEHEARFLGSLVIYRSLENSGHDGYFTEPEVLSTVFDGRHTGK